MHHSAWKSLTVCQPYSALIALGDKRVENRIWSTPYRGPLVIHAGASKGWLNTYAGELPEPLHYSALLCVVDLIDCLHFSPAMRRRPPAGYGWLAEHVHAEGPYCFILDNLRVLPTPIPCAGKQGLWTLPADVAQKLERQLASLARTDRGRGGR